MTIQTSVPSTLETKKLTMPRPKLPVTTSDKNWPPKIPVFTTKPTPLEARATRTRSKSFTTATA
jgi:hypothetical protein